MSFETLHLYLDRIALALHPLLAIALWIMLGYAMFSGVKAGLEWALGE